MNKTTTSYDEQSGHMRMTLVFRTNATPALQVLQGGPSESVKEMLERWIAIKRPDLLIRAISSPADTVWWAEFHGLDDRMEFQVIY